MSTLSMQVADGSGSISAYVSSTRILHATSSSWVSTGTSEVSNGSLRITPADGYDLDYVLCWVDGLGEFELSPNTFNDYMDTYGYYSVGNCDWRDSTEYSVYFYEVDSGGGDSGGGGSSDDYWEIGDRWAIVTGPSSISDYSARLHAWEVEYIRFTPTVTDTYTFTATPEGSNDLVVFVEKDTSPELNNEYDPYDVIYNLDYADKGSSGSESISYKCNAGTTYIFCVSDYDGDSGYVKWSITGTLPTAWQTPVQITSLSANTTYSATSTVAKSKAGYVKYTTPAYAGRLVIETTSGNKTNNYCSYLSTKTLSAGSGTTRTAAVASGYLTSNDDYNSTSHYDTRITYEHTSATATTYYWYVNAAFVNTGNYSIPWKLNYYRKCTLTYNVNNGTGGPAAQTFYADNTTIPISTTKPTRANYEFLGWGTSASATTATYQPGDNLPAQTANYTLYAVWKSQQGTIVYNANNGTGAPANQTFTANPVTISSTAPTRNGYTFKGWSSTSTGGVNYVGGKSYPFTLGTTTTIYAVWELNTYTVSYNMNGGSGTIASQSFNVNNRTITISSTIPTKTGYTFVGWNENTQATASQYNAGQSYTLPSTPLKNYTLYAIWEAKTYTIIYNANGGTGTVATQTKTYGVNLTLASSGYTRTGYTLSHWNTAADNSGTAYALGSTFTDNNDATNMVLYAIWGDNDYSLIYNPNGGSGGPGADTKKTGQTWKVNVTNAPTRNGHTFKGWAESNTAKSPLYKSKTFPAATINVSAANKTLYAVWWPHFAWTQMTKEYANQLVNYIGTYLGITVPQITTTTSLLYLTSWYNQVASALGIEQLPAGTKVIQETHLQDLANAFNSY